MNTDTGELRRIKESLTEEERKELFGEGFTEVPKDLEEEAEKVLAGRDKAFADMKKKTPLTDWANSMKPGRNNPCPCGSGKKYKKCCGK